MQRDIVKELGYLFLASRMKRLAERMQADVLRIGEDAGIDIQPSQYPLLAALDRYGPLTIGDIAEAMGASQPGVTRILSKLTALGLVEAATGTDRRQKTISLTEAGKAAMAQSKRDVWPQVEAAATELCDGLDGDLLTQIGQIEAALDARSLAERAADGPAHGLLIRDFSDELAPAFHDINAAWIADMFTLEQTDRDVLENPRARIVDPGGVILFAEADGEIVGTCALQKTGAGSFELTKMGVTAAARGRKVGEFLLHAVVRRARNMGIERLYLLTNRKCAPAIHLYEKIGFEHDADIMQEYGTRYARCDVAMLYRG